MLSQMSPNTFAISKELLFKLVTKAKERDALVRFQEEDNLKEAVRKIEDCEGLDFADLVETEILKLSGQDFII